MKSGMYVMAFTGVLSFLALYFLAEPIAHLVIADKEQIFSIADITSVIRWVSFALLVVPIMSIVRGFFQGYQKMMPSSVSQLIEQIVRIIAVLTGAYIVVNYMHESTEKAINFAVFAAFIGSIAGLVVLFWFWRKYKPELDYLLENSTAPSSDVSFKSMYIEVFSYVLPFVLVGN